MGQLLLHCPYAHSNHCYCMNKIMEAALYKMESICWLQVAKSPNLLDNNLSIVVEGTDFKGDLSNEQEQ